MKNSTNPNNVDLYFLDSTEAYKTAILQNKFGTFDDLQICYYNGEEVENAPENMINVPIDKLYDFFSESKLRYPQGITARGLNLDPTTKKEIELYFYKAIKNANIKKKALAELYKQEIQNMKLDFTEPLRILFLTTRITSVMQYAAKNVAEAFKKLGFETLISIEDNNMQSWGINESDFFAFHLKNIHDFKPHIIFNINNIHNSFLPDAMFNIIWYQDPVPELITPDFPINLRDRDFLFSLFSPLDCHFKKKNLPYKRQRFGINKKIYKKDKTIKREKKIVFIGSSHRDLLHQNTPKELLDEILEMFKKGIIFNKKTTKKLAKKYDQEFTYIHTVVICAIIRDYSVIELCKMNTSYKIEIYGWGWEHYKEIQPFYKGPLKYGEEISKVYNSAMYSLSPHSGYILQQRVLESAASGCIPIVYDCRINDKPPYFEDNLIFYAKPKDIEKILSKNQKKDLKKIVKKNTYKDFVKKLLKIVKNKTSQV